MGKEGIFKIRHIDKGVTRIYAGLETFSCQRGLKRPKEHVLEIRWWRHVRPSWLCAVWPWYLSG